MRRTVQKEATRQRVLDAARDEFEEVGYEAASVRGIAARAGVASGTVLHHFTDKRQLLHSALFEDLRATLEAAMASPGPGPLRDQLVRLAEAALGYYRARPGLSRALLRESLFAEEPWAGRFAGQVAELHGAIGSLAAVGKARRELGADADERLLGVAWFSFFYFVLIAWAQGQHLDPEGLFARLLDQHMDGIRPKGEMAK
jgi:AcrR family transcriptional regulator